MTTLSKEEFKLLLSNSVASPDLDKVQDAIADLVAENERLTDSNRMYLDRIEHLERKDRCHSEYAKRPILYTDGVNGEQCCRDDLWAVSTAELSAMTDQLTATRTALAAATNLLIDIKASLVIASQDLVGSGRSLDSEISDIDNFLNPQE